MKGKQTLRRFDSTAFTPGGLQKECSNKSPLSRSAGRVELACPVCGIKFTRKPSELKRHAVSYCGLGCRGVAQRKQVITKCKSCAMTFYVKKSSLGRVTCCSEPCRRAVLSTAMSTIDKQRWKEGIYGPGEMHPSATLTKSQVEAVRMDTMNNAEIGRRLGVTRATIRNIKIGKTWAKQNE